MPKNVEKMAKNNALLESNMKKHLKLKLKLEALKEMSSVKSSRSKSSGRSKMDEMGMISLAKSLRSRSKDSVEKVTDYNNI